RAPAPYGTKRAIRDLLATAAVNRDQAASGPLWDPREGIDCPLDGATARPAWVACWEMSYPCAILDSQIPGRMRGRCPGASWNGASSVSSIGVARSRQSEYEAPRPACKRKR